MINFYEKLLNLNDKQKKAVELTEGPLMVVAGPGSGKTELLSLRTAQILKETQISPHNILLLTFTDSASSNMRERLVGLIGEVGYRVGVYTFHSFAGGVMSQYPEYFFDGANFSVASEVVQISLIQEILKNLPRKNTLTSIHLESGFVYERDIKSSLSDLKKAGLRALDFKKSLQKNDKEYKEINKIISSLETSFAEIANKRKLEAVAPVYIELFEKLKKIISQNEYAKVLLSTLELALVASQVESSTSPLTTWKNDYLSKNESDEGVEFIVRDSSPERVAKLYDLAEVYEQYEKLLHENSLYDYEDMLLLVREALNKFANLRFDLQERHQYIMVDEFQDTNEVQFSLIKELVKNDVGETNLQANVMVVGDDDQAIYKFQGAEIGNIFEFRKTFPTSKVIVLDKNYRSTQEVLDLARSVITQAADRLEVRDKNIVKDIKADNKNLLESKVGEIIEKSFEQPLEELQFIATELKNLLDKGVSASEIAVICRKHDKLQELAALLHAYKIPVSYEKKEDVLKQQHVVELLAILKYANEALSGRGEEYLPQIMSFPMWKISPISVWKVVSEARRKSLESDEFGKRIYREISFLETMQDSKEESVRSLAEFLMELTVKAQSLPLEHVIDFVIGGGAIASFQDEKSDIEPAQLESQKTSMYHDFYFNQKEFTENRSVYVERLLALRTFINSLREYKQGELVYVKDLQEFLDIYEGAGNLTMSVSNSVTTAKNSVSLLTAHRAKGLEFEYVFILSADDDTWAARGYSSKISFPKNMIFGPGRDNEDDKIRLLFVALTRAKHTLYITHSNLKVRFLGKSDTFTESSEISDKSLQTILPLSRRVFTNDEEIILQKMLENYSMPVTHLNNFLNFTRVGPSKFVEQNILHFPQPPHPSAAYGTAMHEVIERLYQSYKKNGSWADLSQLEQVFTLALKKGRLSNLDYKKYLEDGLEKLANYYNFAKERGVAGEILTEVMFGKDVRLGAVPISGAIDRLEIEESDVKVTDLKTGKSFSSFDDKGLSEDDKIKLHFYKYQLIFYTLLLENSPTYNKCKVESGALEFVEGNKLDKIEIATLNITKEMQDRVKNLTDIIYNKIMQLDFPSTENYKPSLKDIIQFEDDLLSGKI
jgi:DNA helicase-2/ATP-dependent DNA helicase PcrA